MNKKLLPLVKPQISLFLSILVYSQTWSTICSGYSRCLSVMASTIPRSRKTALATIFAPIRDPTCRLYVSPCSSSHSIRSGSSLRRMDANAGGSTFQEPLLLDTVQVTARGLQPGATNDNCCVGSFVMVALLKSIVSCFVPLVSQEAATNFLQDAQPKTRLPPFAGDIGPAYALPL